jgi:hypothetical protein
MRIRIALMTSCVGIVLAVTGGWVPVALGSGVQPRFDSLTRWRRRSQATCSPFRTRPS